MSLPTIKSFNFIGEKLIHQGGWLRLKEYQYTNPYGRVKRWEVAERTTRTGMTDAVDVLAIVKKQGHEQRIVLVKQYRPPIKGWTIEMPAGLVDPNEAVETTAVRELKEETGYTGVVVRPADAPIVSDPGLTNANLQMVQIDIDLDDPNNEDVKPDVNDAFIETLLFPMKNLKANLDEQLASGVHVDSRLYHLAVGLEYAEQYF